ncbi:MAG: hypothetical protein KDC84_15500 [Crocinitomicaceae bacterium]|nr:hypothetical protein [Crocinitomicaceae bacterium]
MMKYSLFLFVIALFSNVAWNQENDLKKKKEEKLVECHRKEATEIFDKRYGEWECGRNKGIIDCNEFLEMDPTTNVYFHRNTGKPFSGDCETCHLTGRRSLLIHFKNGREDGIDTSYYPSGCIMAIRNNIEGVRDGNWKFYYDSTYQEYFIENYIGGMKHGPQRYYYKNGNLSKVENYNMNSLDGKKIEYYFSKDYLDSTSLKKKLEIEYKKGKYNGKYLMFTPDGKPLIEEIYVMDVKDGEQKYYHENGNLLRTEEWNKGVRDGEFITFYFDGATIIREENYSKGALNGTYKEYYLPKKDEEPILKVEAIYKNGCPVEQTLYDEFGKEIELDEGEGDGEEGEEGAEVKKKSKADAFKDCQNEKKNEKGYQKTIYQLQKKLWKEFQYEAKVNKKKSLEENVKMLTDIYNEKKAQRAQGK